MVSDCRFPTDIQTVCSCILQQHPKCVRIRQAAKTFVSLEQFSNRVFQPHSSVPAKIGSALFLAPCIKNFTLQRYAAIYHKLLQSASPLFLLVYANCNVLVRFMLSESVPKLRSRYAPMYSRFLGISLFHPFQPTAVDFDTAVLPLR